MATKKVKAPEEKDTTAKAGKSLTAYDPKNREVRLILFKSGNCKITKPATGYSSELVDKETAEVLFAEQVASSQNQ